MVTGMAGAAGSAGAASPAPRAMWVWSRPAPETLVSFASSHGVRELFVSVPAGLGSSRALPWVRQVHDRAAAYGITIQALGSATDWIEHPDAALAWQRDALATGLFTGIHLDVEPWQDARWDADRPALLRDYLDLLAQVGAATDRPVEADVPFWLWTLDPVDGLPVDRAVLDRVDRVTVMSYRDRATGTDSITDVGAPGLATAAAADKPARLAVETNDLGPDPGSAKCTFYGARASTLTITMARVDAAHAGAPAYAGIAVEDYDGWRALR